MLSENGHCEQGCLDREYERCMLDDSRCRGEECDWWEEDSQSLQTEQSQ